MSHHGRSGPGMVASAVSLFAKLRAHAFTWMMRGSFSSFGSGSCVDPPFRYGNLQWVTVGAGVNINRDCWLLTVGDPNPDSSPKLILSDHCGIGMGATISAAHRVRIGEWVLMARHVYISDHGHEFRDPDRPISEQGITQPQAVDIGDHTWLGQNACVMPGVRVGRHCVVGSNAVVTKSVPDFSVVVGAPAVVVRRYDAGVREWVSVPRA